MLSPGLFSLYIWYLALILSSPFTTMVEVISVLGLLLPTFYVALPRLLELIFL